MNKRAPRKKTSPWERTKVQCLLRNRHSGKYYGRFTVNGSQKWVSLGTDVFSIAKLRVRDESAKIDRRRGEPAIVRGGKATVGDLLELYEQQIQAAHAAVPATIQAYTTSLRKIRKTWPGIEAMEPKQITPAAVFDWATRFKNSGAAFTPPGAKKALPGNSPTSVNRAIDVLRRVLDLAVENGQLHANPVRSKPVVGRLKKKIVRKRLDLPHPKQVMRIFAFLEKAGGWGPEASFFCRFLMMSGARIGEVARTTWGHVNWSKKTIHLPGYKTDAAARYIPLFPDLEDLLRSLIAHRKRVAKGRRDKASLLEATDTLLQIRECQKSLNAACRAAKAQRITHHDFRHLFTTTCIEAGIDFLTISHWLGHSDGGTLVMKTYGHLRQEHSQASALKVKFNIPSPDTPPPHN